MAPRPPRTRYGHAFTRSAKADGFRGEGSRGGPKPPARELSPMPHPENRLPAQVSPDLMAMRVWQVIENGMRIRISCDNCSHETIWTRTYMERRLKRLTGLTLVRLALRLRCGGCRSQYIHMSQG
jgi:hypothetical protein